MAALLQAHNVTKTLSGEVPVTLVNGASLEIQAGEFVVIVGPSGSGKSSLLYLLGLLDTPTSGTIILDGQNTSGMSDDQLADLRLAKLGFVFQFHFLLPEFTALENVILPMRRRGLLSEEEMLARGTQLLDSFGLAGQHHKIPKQISGGQAQRVAIARALSNNPEIVLADEPTGNLDTASTANVQKLLRELTKDGKRSVVAVTHDPHFAAAADRVITIVDGKIVA